jgi:uncharacterized membrane protein YdbT with pleckstrin-like domain
MSVQINPIHRNLEDSKQSSIVKDHPNQTFYQSPYNLSALFFCLLITFLFAVYTINLYPWTTDWIELGQVGTEKFNLPIPLFGIIPLFIFAVIVHRLLNYKLVLCEEYVLLVEGLMQWREKSYRIHYEKIQEIGIQQTLIQRILNVGDIHILAVTGEHSSLIMPGVYNPRRVKDSIETRLNSKQ